MPSISDIPLELLQDPGRVTFLEWLAALNIQDERTIKSLMKIYTEATEIHFTTLDLNYLSKLINQSIQLKITL